MSHLEEIIEIVSDKSVQTDLTQDEFNDLLEIVRTTDNLVDQVKSLKSIFDRSWFWNTPEIKTELKNYETTIRLMKVINRKLHKKYNIHQDTIEEMYEIATKEFQNC
jgi:hypothetical protein